MLKNVVLKLLGANSKVYKNILLEPYSTFIFSLYYHSLILSLLENHARNDMQMDSIIVLSDGHNQILPEIRFS